MASRGGVGGNIGEEGDLTDGEPDEAGRPMSVGIVAARLSLLPSAPGTAAPGTTAPGMTPLKLPPLKLSPKLPQLP